jgi:hypothetical protein
MSTLFSLISGSDLDPGRCRYKYHRFGPPFWRHPAKSDSRGADQKIHLGYFARFDLTSPIFAVAEIVVPSDVIDAIPRCPADNRVLECAIEGQCSTIVSGDRRDLLSLKNFRQVQIITARHFLEQL